MSEQTRKKMKLVVKWPTLSYFTIDDIILCNPGEKTITLRTKLYAAIDEEGKFAEIGTVSGVKGRPKKVYAYTPVSKTVLDKAEADGIQPVDRAREKFLSSVPVDNTPSMIVNPLKTVSQKQVVV